MTAALIRQGELGSIKDRELKCSQEEKVQTRKEGIYRKQANDRWIYFRGERVVHDLEINSIRIRAWNCQDEETKIRELKDDEQACKMLVFCSPSQLKD